MIVVGLVVDEDRPVLVVPERSSVAWVCCVQAHQVRVHAFLVEGLSVSPVRLDRSRHARPGRSAPEPSQTHRCVRRISAGLHGVHVVEGDLAAVREVEPMSVVVVPGPDVSIGQPDEDVRRRIPDAEHFVLGHASIRLGG